MTDSFDAATAAIFANDIKMKLTKKQLVEIIDYNASRIKRCKLTMQEKNVEIARLNYSLAQEDVAKRSLVKDEFAEEWTYQMKVHENMKKDEA